MKTIETNATVTTDGRLIAKIPPNILPGEHRVVVVIDEQPLTMKKRPSLDFPVDNYGPWPSTLSLRREDMYGDGGR